MSSSDFFVEFQSVATTSIKVSRHLHWVSDQEHGHQGFIQWGDGGRSFPPKHPASPQKERERKRREREEREREKEGKSVYVFGAMIYLITLRLAEYHRLKSITPQCTKFNVKLVVIGGTIHSA